MTKLKPTKTKRRRIPYGPFYIKYLSNETKKWCPKQPVIHIDDSDIVKPEGYKFESLGWVRDGSASTATKNVCKKGYHVTEATVLTDSCHPVSIFSEIHSSKEKGFTSINDITFSAMERAAALFQKATFVMDRGYDDNKMFQFENFRVRKLTAINALNFYLTLCMAFLEHVSMKSESNALKVAIIQTADPVFLQLRQL